MLLKRTRLARDWRRRPIDFPAGTLETSEREVTEYYQPKHLRLGDTVFVFGRRLLLLDCDAFTRRYFADVLHQPQGGRHEVRRPPPVRRVRELPDYLGLGTPEDSLQSCLALRPRPPGRDLVTAMLNAGKALSFGARLDSAHPEDASRRFVVALSLADGTMKIHEPVVRNSGQRGGLFMSARRVARPGCDPRQPTYYGPRDLRLGATLLVHAHRFRLDAADLFTYRYMREHAEMFAPEAIAELGAYLLESGQLKADVREALERECAEYRAAGEATEAAATAGDGLTEMQQCLQEVHVFDDEAKAAAAAATQAHAGEPGLVDGERKPETVGGDECQYYVDCGNNAELEAERRAEELRRQQAARNPMCYVSGRCSNDPEAGKTVRFGADTKCC